MVRHQQHLRAQPVGRCSQQLALGFPLDVRGQQHARAGGADAHDAAAVVGAELLEDVAFRRRVQQLEHDAVPLPALAGVTTLSSRGMRQQRVILIQRRKQPSDRHRLQHRDRAAAVIGIGVADHHSRQSAHAGRPQVRHDDAAAAVDLRAECGSGIVEQRVIARLRDDRKPLADVQHREPERACRERRRLDQKQRQQRRRADRACRKTARQQQPYHARHRHHDGPCRRRVLLPHRGGKRAHPFEQRPAQCHHRMRELQHHVDWQHHADERERHHGETYDRDRDGVGERRHQRYLLKHRQQQWHQTQRYRPLHPRPNGEPVRLRDPARRYQHDQRHRAERQPEPRCEHRPRIDREHGKQRRTQHHRGRGETPHPQRRRDHRQHVNGALRRHRVAREPRVGERRGEARHRCRLACRQPQCKPRAAAPQVIGKRKHQSRNHRHVQTGDAHQVIDAGAGKGLPL